MIVPFGGDWLFSRLKKFFSFLTGKNFFTFLVCSCLSALFWSIVSLGEEREMEFDISLALKNVPADVVVTTDLPSKVKFTLKDKGSQLLSYAYSGTLPALNIDFRNYDQHSGHVILKNTDITKALYARLQPSTKIVGMKPDVVEYYYNYGLHAVFPVVLRSDVRTQRYYSVSSVRLYPDSVTVYAPKEVLDTMTAVYTDLLQLENVGARMVRRVPLQSVKGTKLDPKTVVARIDVDQITEKSVMVPVRWVNFPATKVLRTFPASVKVTFQVGMSMYKQISNSDFAIVVNYDDVLNSTGEKIHLSLKSVPAGVSHVRISPEYVDYLVEDVAEENN